MTYKVVLSTYANKNIREIIDYYIKVGGKSVARSFKVELEKNT